VSYRFRRFCLITDGPYLKIGQEANAILSGQRPVTLISRVDAAKEAAPRSRQKTSNAPTSSRGRGKGKARAVDPDPSEAIEAFEDEEAPIEHMTQDEIEEIVEVTRTARPPASEPETWPPRRNASSRTKSTAVDPATLPPPGPIHDNPVEQNKKLLGALRALVGEVSTRDYITLWPI
jgi:hypothetical protein